MAPPSPIDHVVILVQENHTTDNYFRSMAAFGANVATDWPISPNPPASDQPHDRHGYYRWLTKQSTGTHLQFDTIKDLPYYAWLAASGAFIENHCSGYGTNSTPNHLLIAGGQTPTLRNPPRNQPSPVWDMPSLPGLASDHGLSWKTYTGSSGYPVKFYKQLQGSPNIARSADIIKDAQAGSLPALSMVWHDSPLDDHPPADVSKGMDAVWQIVDAITKAGAWDSTVFLLTWDDWGGYDDHVATPNVEVTPDGVQLAYGPRVPLLIFGGRVKPGIDHRWSWHPSIPKTALDLLGLPKLGVPRVDNDKGLADLVDISASPKLNPAPPAHRTTITQPTPPQRHPSQRQLRSRRSPCPFRSARSCCGTGPTCPHQTMCPSPLTPAATQAERRSGSARSPHRRGWSHKQLNTRRHGHGAHRSTGPEKPGIPGRIQLPSPTGCRLLSFRKKASLGAASATSLAASSPR